MRKKVVGVVGGHECTRETERMAVELGQKLVAVADILVCGGLSGTMKAACKGFKSAGGTTMGIIPTYNKQDANEFVDIVIPTGLGYARNVLVVKTADAIVALPGETGTLSEIAYALQFGIPVVSLGQWEIKGVIKVKTPDEAAKEVKARLKP